MKQRTLMVRFVVLLAVWTTVTTLANLLLPGSPEASWFVLMVIASMLLPPLIFVLGYRTRDGFRRVVLELDFTAITAVQGMRIAGIAMLSLWAAGSMAPAFALWAGGIDVFIGLTAVPMAFLIAPLQPVRRRTLRLWHALGLLDFVIAIPLGVASTPSAIGVLDAEPSSYDIFSFPLSFIPMVGVPFMITMHLTALLQLHADRTPRCAPLLHRS